MERPSGPLGAATQSSRPMVDNGAPRPAPLNTARRAPPNNIRHAASSSALSTQTYLTQAEVIELTQKKLLEALDMHEKKVAEAAKNAGVTVPGVTIDLSHKQIQVLPEEVVDIIKDVLERLALSHNYIFEFPNRLSECTSLRYLNARNNAFRVFPIAITQLKSLEILDLGRNKIRIIPPEVSKLTSLKVLSLQRNRIEVVPDVIADMASLTILKLDSNPLAHPPREILVFQGSQLDNPLDDNDKQDMIVTARMKKFMKEHMKEKGPRDPSFMVGSTLIRENPRETVANTRSETESGGEESGESIETPRPVKRVMSGRFPVKVNGADLPDLRSPAFAPRPPPIPSRSHYRGLSQQNAALRRPGVMPLTIGSSNDRDRARSKSEGLSMASQDPKDRAAERSRRMGIVSRKAQELGTVDEMKANNRYSHYRGLSHGSAMQVGNNGNTKSPASPADSLVQRATYVKRLSSLPERKQESIAADPVIEAAKSILYALYQVHPMIQNLLGVTRDGSNKRTSLERVFYNANTHVEELDRHIQVYDTYTEEDEEMSPRSNENVHRACVTCVSAYVHVCSLLQRNVEALLNNGDPRFIRSLLLNVYGSIAEIRNATVAFSRARHIGQSFGFDGAFDDSTNTQTQSFQAIYQIPQPSTTMVLSKRENVSGGAAPKDTNSRPQASGQNTMAQQTALRTTAQNGAETTNTTKPAGERMRALTVDDETPRAPTRDRSVTPTHERPGLYQSPYLTRPGYHEQQLRKFKTSGQPPDFSEQLSSALSNHTPRSGESFANSVLGTRMEGGDFTEEDNLFEKIYLRLRADTELAQQKLPELREYLVAAMKRNSQSQRPDVTNEAWLELITTCDKVILATNTLKIKLSAMKLKDPNARGDAFWESCYHFTEGIVTILVLIKPIKQATTLMTPNMLKLAFALKKAVSSSLDLMRKSPWASLVKQRTEKFAGLNSPSSQVPLPMTPQSAALGPAVQATVPSTPRTAEFLIGRDSSDGQTVTIKTNLPRSQVDLSKVDLSNLTPELAALYFGNWEHMGLGQHLEENGEERAAIEPLGPAPTSAPSSRLPLKPLNPRLPMADSPWAANQRTPLNSQAPAPSEWRYPKRVPESPQDSPISRTS